MKRLHIIAGIGLLLGLTIPTLGQNNPSDSTKNAAKGKATLEMVFVLDTTGSMGGLIEGAKQRIWGIVNDVLKWPGRPTVKVGLVAYRDHGDQYVTKVLPITADLDKVYSTLMDYKAEGGGDTPEDVRQALADGVAKVGWTTRTSQVAQILFLVGDAPPHEDYKQEPDVLETTTQAVQNGIVVNTIQCGQIEGTREVWQNIARRGEGQYFAIAQDGGVQIIATPYDKRLAELGNKIGTTYLAYGGGGMGAGATRYRADLSRKQAEVEGKVLGGAPPGAQAERALNKALNSNAYGSDLLQSLENGSVKLETVKKEDLPDDLQKMKPEERKKEVGKRLAERKKIRDEILEISKKRDAFIASERKKLVTNSKQKGFDAAVAEAIKKQAAKKGIKQ